MPTPRTAEWKRYGLLFGLYIVEGVLFALPATALRNWMAERGVDPGAIGSFVAVASLPMSLKIALGPVVDRFRGSPLGARRGWIIATVIWSLAVALALAALGDPIAGLGLVQVLFFAQYLGAATFDVSVDALAIDITPPEQTGRANAAMFAGQSLGYAAGAALFGLALVHVGFRATMLIQATLLLALLWIPLAVLREPTTESVWPWSKAPRTHRATRERPSEAPGMVDVAKRAVKAMVQPSSLWLLLAVFVTHAAIGCLDTVLSVAATQQWGWTSEGLSAVLSPVAMGASLLGILLGASVADRFGHIRVLIAVVVAIALLNVGMYGLRVWWTHPNVVVGYWAIENFFHGMAVPTLMALCMRLSRPLVAATQFSMYMSILNLGSSAGNGASGWAYEQLGVANYFLVFAGIFAGTAVILRRVDPHATRRAYPDEYTL